MFLALELCLAAICLSVAYTHPFGDGFFRRIEIRVAAFARRRKLAVLVTGLAALSIRLALLPILPIPAPAIHDEYSHLLLADTLAHGRLSNPTHPMWIHFETFHVNWQPTYASMYFPGQGLFLALGQVLLGHPFWGVWLSTGLLCAAICWALQGWMPPAWAFVGGLLAVIRLGTFSYWTNSYLGGAVAALGGALVLGAYPRIKQEMKVFNSILLGLGMVALALSRPYEGFFFCLPVITGLAVWAWKHSSVPLTTTLKRVALPAVMILVLGLAWLGYYFWRVTGNPFTTAYQVNIRTYGLVYFPWEKIKQVAPFHHQAMERFYRGSGPVVDRLHYALQHPVALQGEKVLIVWLFYFGPLLTIPWLVWINTYRKKWWRNINPTIRFFLIIVAVTYVSLALTIYIGQPHYAAPMTAPFYAATLLVLRDLRTTASGRSLGRSTILMCSFLVLPAIAVSAFHSGLEAGPMRNWCSAPVQNLRRAQILNQLERISGKHVVIVHYEPGHDFIHDEWVYNEADIDEAKVVWARDMGSKNSELLDYFNNRKAWFLEPDIRPARLTAYANKLAETQAR